MKRFRFDLQSPLDFHLWQRQQAEHCVASAAAEVQAAGVRLNGAIARRENVRRDIQDGVADGMESRLQSPGLLQKLDDQIKHLAAALDQCTQQWHAACRQLAQQSRRVEMLEQLKDQAFAQHLRSIARGEQLELLDLVLRPVPTPQGQGE
jgi:flagellar export protein FliJ